MKILACSLRSILLVSTGAMSLQISHAAVTDTINPNGKTLVDQTTAGTRISLADMQALITAAGDLTAAGVLNADDDPNTGGDFTADVDYAATVAAGGHGITGANRYGRTGAGGDPTSGSKFGYVAGSNTWTLSGDITHFGATFYERGPLATGIWTVTANFSGGGSDTFTSDGTMENYWVGFAAPAGETIDSIAISETVTDWGTYDDVSFVAVTSPSTDFTGTDLLVPGDWTNGLPVVPAIRGGTVTQSGVFNDGNAGVADWALTMTGGTVTAGQDWSFKGASSVTIEGGTLDVAGNILVEDTTVMTFSGGAVSWDGTFDTGTSYDSTILISGGTFDGTATGTTTFGNMTGSGVITITGGTISASLFDFSSTNSLASIGGTAVLDGTGGTFGVLDINPDWYGSFTLSSFSGTNWEDEFLAGNITLNGTVLDAVGFAANFSVTNRGQTLSFDPSTEFQGGDLLTDGNWTNGRPLGRIVGTIATSGTATGINNVFGWEQFTLESGTLDVTNDWSFEASQFTMNGGTLNVSDDIFCNNATYVFNDGTVTWNDRFEPNGSVGGTITIAGGTFTATGASARFGNSQIGTTTVTGGTITSPNLIFTTGSSSIGGSAVLVGDTGTFGALDIASDWTGSLSLSTFTGTDWENQFISGNITLDGVTLDLAGFTANFAVSTDGMSFTRGTGGTPSSDPTQLVVVGFDGLGAFVMDASNLDPAKTYELTTSPDFSSFGALTPQVIVDGASGAQQRLKDENPPVGKAFYRLEEQ